MGRLVRVGLPVLCTLAIAPAPSLAGTGAKPSIVGLTPARRESLLVCSLETRGLPDEPSRETLLSGLPSALVVAFSLLNASGEEIGRSQVEVRVEPDLWEQIFIIRTPLMDRRVNAIEDVTDALRALGPLPVLPLPMFDPGLPLRIRSRLAVHPLAPTEILEVQNLFGARTEEGEADRREVSVGLGSLVRYFLGRHTEQDWVAEATSRPFEWNSLEDVRNNDPGSTSEREGHDR